MDQISGFIEFIDRYLFLLINGFHCPIADEIMWWISGKWTWIPLYAILLYFAIKKEKNNWWIFILAVVALISCSDLGSVHLFKNVFQRYRPCHNFEIMDMVHLVNGKCGGKYGFISSHASNSFALAGFLSQLFANKKVTFSLFFWATLVSYSRIYLGVHYPADILAGALFGLIISYLIFKLYLKIRF